MCLHLIDGTGGWRIGSVYSLDDSVEYEKVFFERDGEVVTPEPAPVVLFGTGLLLVGAVRRRRNRKA